MAGEYRLSDGVTIHAFEYNSSTNTGIDLNNATFMVRALAASCFNRPGRSTPPGRLAGSLRTASGAIHAFLLTPVAVPEPSTLLLVATECWPLAYACGKRS